MILLRDCSNNNNASLFCPQVSPPLFTDLTPSSSQLAVAMTTLIESEQWSRSCVIVQHNHALDAFTQTLRHVTSSRNVDAVFFSNIETSDSLTVLERKLRGVRRVRCQAVMLHAQSDLSRRIFELFRLVENLHDDVVWLLSDLVTTPFDVTSDSSFATGALLFRLNVTSDVMRIAHALGAHVGATLQRARVSHSEQIFAQTHLKRSCFVPERGSSMERAAKQDR